ncbi:hypothetical protein SCHPADRAFT_69062 [Schizopora paradoxa]|uniref:Transmembrane protein n=1 Tax=Schizopora paradoxa TaxID=27342 RepID=A0A0H2S4W5_9AGAM|nr:hypothetical protein SCHPADRAFT_69062 [Schizopora paradoxa]
MVDWHSPVEVQKDGAIFSKLMHALLGVYLWEFAISLDFDVDFLLGRKQFRWPLIFYFAGRYSLLFALIGIAIALNVTVEINCQALYVFNQVFGNAAIGFASINLSLRTIAVYSQSYLITIPLVLLILGHWSLLLHGLLITAQWIPGTGCAITKTNNTVLAATFCYGMSFDAIVLALTAWKLLSGTQGGVTAGVLGAIGLGASSQGSGRRRGPGRSRLVKLIFGDGLIFFIVAFLSNLIATIFMLLNLNAVLSIIFNVPAAIASTIVASRAVRRLTQYTARGAEVFSAGQQSSTLAFRNRSSTRKVGVHVQMDTYTLAETATVPTMGMHSAAEVKPSFVEYDAAGHVKGDNYTPDPEAQEISDDFKRPPY